MKLDEEIRKMDMMDIAGDRLSNIDRAGILVPAHYKIATKFYTPPVILYQLDLREDYSPKYMTTWIPKDANIYTRTSKSL